MKGRGNFKCDCPHPFKGRRCEKGLKKILFFHVVVGLQTSHICTIYNKQNMNSNYHVLSSQVQNIVRKEYVGVVNVC